ncbi:MAG TPA: glycosyltransferase [Candidatus Deferrimicrobiaceae bacterium]|nr:glycosyltransferase [Candidatus Deferrimicrobiaceae bacterium]
MKICLVTTFPPSQGGLSEYGLHIAHELQRNPFIRLTVLADTLSSPAPELPKFTVERCWSFNDAASSARILNAIRKQKPDVVWFNLLFSTFGRNPLVAFAGLITPLLSRLSGCYTHVTLHHLIDTVNLQDAGVRYARTYRLAGAVATRMLLLANSVSVLMPGYRKILHEKYGRDNVHLRSHGILSREPQFPDSSRRGNPEHRILAFGKWGTYKRLELMIEAFQYISEALPNARLVVAGGNHPQAAGYVESMKKKCAANPKIEFTGYVDEDDLPDLFQSSSVAVMPYSSSTGCSGVAHLACAYGVPVVCADLEDFRQMSDGEGMAIEFYKPGDAKDLADCLIRFLSDPTKQQNMAEQNFSAALRMTMPNIVLKYLRHFELEQRTLALRHITRFRKLPSWVPSKSLLLRLMTGKSLGWVHRSALHRPAPTSNNGHSSNNHSSNHNSSNHQSLNNHVDSGGKLAGTRIPMNGNGVMDRSGSIDGASAANASGAPARSSQHTQREDGAESDPLCPALTPPLPQKTKAHDPEAQ